MHLAGECHAQREQQQEYAAHPGELARVFVRAKKKDLNHVQRHDRHHEIGSPVVHRAQIPAPELSVVQILRLVHASLVEGMYTNARQAPVMT